MGGYPPHGTGPGEFQILGGSATERADSMAEDGRKVGVHPGGGCKSRGRVLADGNLHSVKAEYYCAVYCNAITYGTLRGGREEAGGMGGDTVVGTGGN